MVRIIILILVFQFGVKAQCFYQIPSRTPVSAHNAVFADFNNDGNVDYVNYNYSQVDYRLGTGTSDDYNLNSGGSVAFIGSPPSGVSGLDFNNDGKMDLAVIVSNSVVVFQNNANMSFAPIYTTSLAGTVTKLICKDINNDNQTDLLLFSYGTNSCIYSARLNQGNGNFSSQPAYTSTVVTDNSDLCDFNGDNILDLITINNTVILGNKYHFLTGNGSGFYSSPVMGTFLGNTNLTEIITGDFNNDLKNDFATISTNTLGISNIIIRYGNGSGGFPASATVNDVDVKSINFKDMNNDNLQDLVYGSGQKELVIRYNNGTTLFANRTSLLTDNPTLEVNFADLNNDNNLDLISTNSNSISLEIFNLGNKNYRAITTYPSHIAAANVLDVNNDGWKDVVGSTLNGIDVIFNNASNSFTSQVSYTNGVTCSSGTIIRFADVNNNGTMDVVKSCGTTSGFNINLFLSNSVGTFTNTVHIMGSNNNTGMELADFNNDNKIDIAVTNSSQQLVIFLGNGNGTFNANAINLAFAGTSLEISDFNNDNIKDIVVGTYNSIGVLLGNGDGTFQNPINKTLSLTNGPVDALKCHDFNSDGYKDIVTKRYLGSTIVIQIVIGGAANTFTVLPTFFSQAAGPSVSGDMILTDINSDSKMDVIYSTCCYIRGIYNTTGTQFGGPSELYVGTDYIYSLCETDLNNDSKPDILASVFNNNISQESLILPIYRSNMSNAPLFGSADICSSSSATLNINTTTPVNWYASSSTSAPLGSGAQFVTPVLTTSNSASTFSYFAINSNTFCAAFLNSVAVTVTVQNCVWPGDLDYDLSVSNTDLFPLGIYFGQTGNQRNNPTINWAAQKCTDWSFSQGNFYNGKHVDSNGDGIVNFSDTLAIVSNYNLLHLQKSQIVTAQTCSNNPIYLSFNKALYYPADTILCNVNYGYQSAIQNCYGIAFDLNYDQTLVKSVNTGVESTTSWLGNNLTEKINFNKIDNNAGIISSSQTRLDHLNKTGYGKLITYKFVLKDTLLLDKMGFDLNNVIKIDSIGNLTPIIACLDSIDIVQGVVGLKELSWNNTGYSIMPNPFTGLIRINNSNNLKDINIEVMDLSGRILLKEKLDTSKQINLSHLSNGTYIIKVSENYNKPIFFKIIKQ